MTHPTAADYNESIQNLRSLAGDEELRDGEVACNRLGLPLTYSGNFADVYQVRCARRTVAVKCFTRGAPGLRQRYREISAHLKRSRLPFMVDFDYVEQGLRVNGTWQPLLKMQWVEGGLGLNEFVAQYLDRPSALRQLLALWVKLAARLRQAEVAHADLQHGNVLLVPVAGSDQLSLKLIDYDGMHVPSLAGQASGELGHPCYQHPQRLREGTYSGEVDRFSHLVIYCAVSSLLAGGRPLWERFNNQENLLFREADFADPGQSELFRELWTLRNPGARALVGHLLLATQRPLDQVPLLEEIFDGSGQARPLSVEQERQAAAVLGNGSHTAPDSPSSVSLAVAPTGPETIEAELVPQSSVSEIVDAELVSEPVPFPVWVKNGAIRTAAAIPIRVRQLDTLLAKLAGPENDLLHQFFRVLAVAVPLTVLVLIFHTASPQRKSLVGSVPAAQRTDAGRDLQLEQQPTAAELALLVEELMKAEDSWSAAWQTANRELLAKHAAASLLEIEEKAALAETRVQDNDWGEAARLYREVLDLLTRARAEIPPLPALAVAPFDAPQAAEYQQAWAEHLGTAIEVTNSIGMKLRLIPPGEFMMGSPDGEADRSSNEGPEHRVRITKPFYLGVYEVTQGEYAQVMGGNPSQFLSVSGEDTGRFPVERVSWEDAVEFCRKLSALSGEQSSGRVYRLPTEAEWEYACRAGTTTPFHFGSTLNGEEANFFPSTLSRTARVGSYAANSFGLYDMHGNVREWCSDRYASDYYGASPVDNPAGPTTGSFRVLRGGSWDSYAWFCRAALRDWDSPTHRGYYLGFRVASVPVDATGK